MQIILQVLSYKWWQPIKIYRTRGVFAKTQGNNQIQASGDGFWFLTIAILLNYITKGIGPISESETKSTWKNNYNHALI